MRRIPFLFTLLLVCAQAVGAQSVADHPRVREATGLIETWLDAQQAYQRIPGVSAAVVHDQEVIWSGARGFADPESGTPATTTTAYSICSISKLFTSIGVMQLRDAGALRLDDRVGDLIPWFDIQASFDGSPPVTVEGILTHSSGLPRESDFAYWVDPFDFPTREQVVRRLGEQEMLYPAERYYQYSNLGLTLAGEIVAALSGESFADYMLSRILDPIGMSDTWPDIGEYPFPDRLAVGYSALRRDGTRKRLPPFAPEGISPAAGFASTAEDLARFASLQLQVLGQGRNPVLSGNTLREMQRVHWMDPDWKTSRGLGFGVYRSEGETYVGHSGSCPGYETTIQLYTPNRTAAVVLMNSNGVNPSAMALEMLRIVDTAVPGVIGGRESEAQDSAATPNVPAAMPEEFQRFVGAYDETPWGGESAVVPWKGGLAILWLPTMSPLDDLTFRRVRDDGDLGEAYEFMESGSGQVTGLRYHSNTYPRMD
ncbi:MAG: serine hydrolase domain-containing protein [Gemmatimonadota bacterium]